MKKLNEKQKLLLQSILREEFDRTSDPDKMRDIINLSEKLKLNQDWVNEMRRDFRFERILTRN